jgi:hypothetical protein
VHLGIEIRDFDLERLGFSLSVLAEPDRHPVSEGYLRMTLAEMNAFLKALRAANERVDVSTFEPTATSKMKRAPTDTARGEVDAALPYNLRR